MSLKNKQILLICLLLAAVTLTAFRQLNRCEFINYDDPEYVADNVHIRRGVTMDAIRWAFTTGYACNWHPVTWMSHMLDVELFGLNPHRHHLVNLLFHTANTLLLFFVFNRMTKAPWKSAFVAALFALHPLHVESVAWVAERKDVLSTLFWMLTTAAYVRYVELKTDDERGRTEANARSSVFGLRSSVLRYVAVIVFFAMGLMSKPMLVTLPFVLLLLDYWPLGRMSGSGCQVSEVGCKVSDVGTGKPRRKKVKSGKKSGQDNAPFFEFRPPTSVIRPLMLEKIPLFALAALSCIVTYVVHQQGGSVSPIEMIPFGARVANALVSCFIYMEKALFPCGLAVFYPHPGSRPLWQAAGAALFFGVITLAVIREAKRSPYLAVGWFWFAGTLVPVIGIVQVGAQAMADRYTYIPLTGLFIMAAWGRPALLNRCRLTGSLYNALFLASWGIVLSCFLIATNRQVEKWKNSLALYDHALEITGPSSIICNNRGLVYYRLGDMARACADFDRAIELDPGHSKAYNNRGIAHARLGSDRQAISDFDRAIEIRPDYAMAFVNRGLAYSRLGNQRKAVEDYKRALEIDPKYANAYLSLGEAYGKIGDPEQSVESLQKAASLGNETAKELLKSRGTGW